MGVSVVVVGPFEEAEEETSIASDVTVVKMEGEVPSRSREWNGTNGAFSASTFFRVKMGKPELVPLKT